MTAPGLVYYPDDRPGILRRRHGRGFTYVAPDGTTIADRAERRRLTGLAIPPAYEDVWITPLVNGHLQATGRDARQRKQYRYHPDWTTAQAQTKFDQLIGFGTSLPRIRRRVRRDLTQEAGEKTFALAGAVAMIDRLALRVGHETYTRENGSYGALTLRNRHVSVTGGRIRLDFTAKGGKRVKKQVADRTLARLLNKIGDLPGAPLLAWVDDDGMPQTVSSEALNRYLSDAAGDADAADITAKTFRTWAGTLAAFEAAIDAPCSITTLSKAAARRLHNTATIARNSYIHPDVLNLADTSVELPPANSISDLRVAEAQLLAFLKK